MSNDLLTLLAQKYAEKITADFVNVIRQNQFTPKGQREFVFNTILFAFIDGYNSSDKEVLAKNKSS